MAGDIIACASSSGGGGAFLVIYRYKDQIIKFLMPYYKTARREMGCISTEDVNKYIKNERHLIQEEIETQESNKEDLGDIQEVINNKIAILDEQIAQECYFTCLTSWWRSRLLKDKNKLEEAQQFTGRLVSYTNSVLEQLESRRTTFKGYTAQEGEAVTPEVMEDREPSVGRRLSILLNPQIDITETSYKHTLNQDASEAQEASNLASKWKLIAGINIKDVYEKFNEYNTLLRRASGEEESSRINRAIRMEEKKAEIKAAPARELNELAIKIEAIAKKIIEMNLHLKEFAENEAGIEEIFLENYSNLRIELKKFKTIGQYHSSKLLEKFLIKNLQDLVFISNKKIVLLKHVVFNLKDILGENDLISNLENIILLRENLNKQKSEMQALKKKSSAVLEDNIEAKQALEMQIQEKLVGISEIIRNLKEGLKAKEIITKLIILKYVKEIDSIKEKFNGDEYKTKQAELSKIIDHILQNNHVKENYKSFLKIKNNLEKLEEIKLMLAQLNDNELHFKDQLADIIRSGEFNQESFIIINIIKKHLSKRVENKPEPNYRNSIKEETKEDPEDNGLPIGTLNSVSDKEANLPDNNVEVQITTRTIPIVPSITQRNINVPQANSQTRTLEIESRNNECTLNSVSEKETNLPDNNAEVQITTRTIPILSSITQRNIDVPQANMPTRTLEIESRNNERKMSTDSEDFYNHFEGSMMDRIIKFFSGDTTLNCVTDIKYSNPELVNSLIENCRNKNIKHSLYNKNLGYIDPLSDEYKKLNRLGNEVNERIREFDFSEQFNKASLEAVEQLTPEYSNDYSYLVSALGLALLYSGSFVLV